MIDKSVGQALEEFHDAFGRGGGQSLRQILQMRMTLIEEEYEEVMAELYGLEDALLSDANTEELNISYKLLLKELCDLVYVTVGTADALGMNFDGAFLAVHESNMSKLGADGKPLYREDGKVLKGPNYKKPRMDPYV